MSETSPELSEEEEDGEVEFHREFQFVCSLLGVENFKFFVIKRTSQLPMPD